MVKLTVAMDFELAATTGTERLPSQRSVDVILVSLDNRYSVVVGTTDDPVPMFDVQSVTPTEPPGDTVLVE
jgi:hypothetical protein